jgi:hypothetical protein
MPCHCWYLVPASAVPSAECRQSCWHTQYPKLGSFSGAMVAWYSDQPVADALYMWSMTSSARLR